MTHLSKVFEKLRAHKLYAKMSKCTFGMPQVEYLSHSISKEGVATDPSKVEAMVKWPKPSTQQELRGFRDITASSYGITEPLASLSLTN